MERTFRPSLWAAWGQDSTGAMRTHLPRTEPCGGALLWFEAAAQQHKSGEFSHDVLAVYGFVGRQAQHDVHLHAIVGVVLRHAPDLHEQDPGIHSAHPAFG